MFRDLLSSSIQQKLDIKMGSDGSLFVQGLTSREVRDLKDVNKVEIADAVDAAVQSI